MAEVFKMPTIGDAMVEAEIVEWFVAVGDDVELDQPICSIETDKSVVELTSPFRGTVTQLGAVAGATLAVGEPLLIVGGDSPTVAPAAPASVGTARPAPPAAAPTAPASSGGSVVQSPVVRRLAVDLGVDLSTVRGTGIGGRVTRADVVAAGEDVSAAPRPQTRQGVAVRAMPRVRKVARDQAIDLRTIGGTGPGGAITIEDLTQPEVGVRRERLSATRRAIGQHLAESARTIPQFTSMVEVDAAGLLATRSALRDRSDGPMPLDAVLMALLIPVLRDHPLMRAMVDADDVVFHGRYDLGVAVDTPDGLMVPVVRGADGRSVAELGVEIDRLATACRERRIQPSDLTGATCTVNNVGSLGLVAGTPILPIGTSAIVAFGVARPVVRLDNGNPIEVPTMTISATFDHRLVDGGDAGRFLTQLKAHLEVPALGLLS